MKNTIYHNPRCSKSRETLKLLQEHGADVAIVEYLGQPPSKDELRKICKLLGKKPLELVRTKEELLSETMRYPSSLKGGVITFNLPA